jgi:hypothetical protein
MVPMKQEATMRDTKEIKMIVWIEILSPSWRVTDFATIESVGIAVAREGAAEGDVVGLVEGERVGVEGAEVGTQVGRQVGTRVGETVG